MLATLATTFVTAFSIGGINAQGNEPNSAAFNTRGHSLHAMSLPPRSRVQDLSGCHWLSDPKVWIGHGKPLKPHWNRDHDIESFGPVQFDGMSFTNFTGEWANISAHIFAGCKG